MNQRIRELALEAGEYVNSVYTPPVRSNTPGKIWEDGHVDWHTQFNQKFAQLIVQECAVYCEGHILPKGMAEENDLNYNDGVMDCAIGLKQHFGVEQ
jgi:hypothetical protein